MSTGILIGENMIDMQEGMDEKKTYQEIRIGWSFAHNKKYRFRIKVAANWVIYE